MAGPSDNWRYKLYYRGMFGIRVKTGHKNIAEAVHPGKTATCIVAQVGSHLPCSSIRAEAGVRKRFCQAVRQQTVFTRMKLNRSSVREGLCFWTDFPVAGNYTYPEHTPIIRRPTEVSAPVRMGGLMLNPENEKTRP
jgi:hypothetical protein